MVGTFQPLPNNAKIINPDGTPTEYFIRWAQSRGIDVEGAASLEEVLELFANRSVIAGTGLSGGGTLDNDVTLNLDAGLDDLNDVDLTTTPTDGQALVYDNGSGFWLPGSVSGGGGAWTTIETYNGNGTDTSHTFSSLGSYSDLRLVGVCRMSGAVTVGTLNMRFNADSGSNYETSYLTNNGTSPAFAGQVSQTQGFAGFASGGSSTAGSIGTISLDIPQYRSTSIFKSGQGISRAKAGGGIADLRVFFGGFNWLNTAAITSITIFPSSGNFGTQTVLSLLGRT